MENQEIRRLAVIMFTDMVGYSKKMQQNEDRALTLLNEHNIILQRCIDKFGGKTVKTIGDAFLAEFASVHDAIHAAVLIQKDLIVRNDEHKDGEPINVRIGIHAGDITFRDNDVFGDGVNIAARIESIANGKQILVSGNVYSMITGKIEFPFKYLGPRELKNISQPVKVFEVMWESEGEEFSAVIMHSRVAMVAVAFLAAFYWLLAG